MSTLRRGWSLQLFVQAESCKHTGPCHSSHQPCSVPLCCEGRMRKDFPVCAQCSNSSGCWSRDPTYGSLKPASLLGRRVDVPSNQRPGTVQLVHRRQERLVGDGRLICQPHHDGFALLLDLNLRCSLRPLLTNGASAGSKHRQKGLRILSKDLEGSIPLTDLRCEPNFAFRPFLMRAPHAAHFMLSAVMITVACE